MGPVKNKPAPTEMGKGRASVWSALRQQPDPVGIDALARAIGRHPNTLREQLAWLVEHGFATRVKQPSFGRGRPAWLYQANGARPGDAEHVEVAAALAWRLQDASPETHEEARAAGRAWGAELVAARQPLAVRTPEDGRRWTVQTMDELGYQPEADRSCDHVVLHRCPLLQAAHRFPEVVCSMHLGLVQACLDGSGADPDRTELTPFSAPGECHLRLLA